MSEQDKRKGKRYVFATVGALTERGGRVTSGGGGKICGLRIARVADVVTYADGSEAVIVDGAGFAAVMGDQPAALVGSRLSNGDRIISTPWEDQKCGIFVEDGKPIEGLFDPAWTPPPRKPNTPFAVVGSTTARGGVLREVSSDWEIDDTHRKAGKIGDFVEYLDGMRARIVTGVGIPGDSRNCYAIVGSKLDNGDVITDSPARASRMSTVFVPVDAHGVAIGQQ